MDNMDKEPRPSQLKRRTFIIGAVSAVAIFGMYQLAQNTPSTTEGNKEIEIPRDSVEFSSTPSWEQNFVLMSEALIDTSVWRYETDPNVPGYNDEKQAYTTRPENVRIEPGRGLVIEAHKVNYHYPDDQLARNFEYTSGRIDTLDSFNFTYGKVEARMKLPSGAGTWPAFWLLSANQPYADESIITETTDQRYYMKNGEIDIIEYYGHTPNRVEGTVHTFADSNSGHASVFDAPYTFHTYGVEIYPTGVTWTIDGVPYYTFEKPSDNPDEWPFTEENKLYIILNLAMGGTGGGPIGDTAGPWRMEVQSVAYYDYIDK